MGNQSAKLQAVRVASLSPGLTATMVTLGVSDRLVGRTPWCEVSTDVPIVGSLLDLNAEALVLARPTVILLQPPAQGEIGGLSDLATTHGWRVERFQIDSLADVQSMLENLPKVICDPTIENDCAKLQERSQIVQRELTKALEPIADANRAGRTLVLLVSSESVDAMGFGKSSYIGDALDRMGVTNALLRSGYPSLGAEDLAKLAPETVVVISQRSAWAIEQLAQIMPNSVLYSIHAPELLQPGGGMISGLIKLREALTQACQARDKNSPTSTQKVTP
ncbi:MAG: hypothetical protein WCL33_05650 [Planctomycetota bacterium]